MMRYRNEGYQEAMDEAMRQRDVDVAATPILVGDGGARKLWKKLIL
jgi:hypothetical protein